MMPSVHAPVKRRSTTLEPFPPTRRKENLQGTFPARWRPLILHMHAPPPPSPPPIPSFERAEKFGLSPPPNIKALLTESAGKQESLWHCRI